MPRMLIHSLRSLIVILLLSIATLASGQDLQQGDWSLIDNAGACIGGTTCKERSLRVQLVDRPIVAVRFQAHDAIGNKAEGALRVKIDGTVVESYLDIPRKGQLFTLEVDELRGRYLVFEPASNDEVQITAVSVLYANLDARVPGRRDDRGGRVDRGSGWRAYPRSSGCIGGDECGRNGDRITIALEDAPVLGIRFFAHDQIGTKADGNLTVRIDDKTIGWPIDVKREGRLHELDVENIYGTKLIIETNHDDEVDIKDIEVLYGIRSSRRGSGHGPGRREVTHEGACIGGSECGGRKARIRIPIDGRMVESIRFYARDDIGTRAGGELKIRIDDEVLEYGLDIPREGRTFTIDGNGIEGDYVIIEPAEDDEVEVKDVRVRFADGR